MAERRRVRQQASGGQPPPQRVAIEARLRWDPEPQIPILYANQLFISGEGNQFVLTFGAATLPLEHPITEEIRERLKTEGLRVVPVVRIAVGIDAMGWVR